MRKKTFYVDGHEKPAQRQHRHNFSQKYLQQWEPCSHRWIQITNDQLLTCKKNGEIPESITGYQYLDVDSKEMVVLHVDTCEYAFQLGNKRTTYGGNLSVRFPTNQKKQL